VNKGIFKKSDGGKLLIGERLMEKKDYKWKYRLCFAVWNDFFINLVKKVIKNAEVSQKLF